MYAITFAHFGIRHRFASICQCHKILPHWRINLTWYGDEGRYLQEQVLRQLCFSRLTFQPFKSNCILYQSHLISCCCKCFILNVDQSQAKIHVYSSISFEFLKPRTIFVNIPTWNYMWKESVSFNFNYNDESTLSVSTLRSNRKKRKLQTQSIGNYVG